MSVAERNLLADTAKIVEKNKIQKRKDDLRKIVTDGLSSLGYDSSLCKSKWEKSSSFPAGTLSLSDPFHFSELKLIKNKIKRVQKLRENIWVFWSLSGEYEYIDVMAEGERLFIDIDFRSEFEIARSTGAYKAILQSLPYIFVGKSDRIGQIVSIVSEAAKQSLKKKGMHIPPWRKAEYMRAKWLSPYTRTSQPPPKNDTVAVTEQLKANDDAHDDHSSDCGELDLIFGEKTSPPENDPSSSPVKDTGDEERPVSTWQPPAIKPKSVERGAKIVTGLASLLKDKP